MAYGKQTPKVNEQTKNTQVNNNDDFETMAIVKPMNVFDTASGKYTTEVNTKTVRVETFVKDIHNEKPVVIGYILVATMERFLNGEVKTIPIKMKKVN